MLHRALRLFFRLLYHELAWSYDLVAAAVSLGRWNDWVESALPFAGGTRILELAYGTGKLQQTLLERHHGFVTGIDESRQMARLARSRLGGGGQAGPELIQARAQQLPYRGQAFDTVVATFPTEFIQDAHTLDEVRRVLCPTGRLVVVAAAWIVGRRVLDRAAAWLFRTTRQTPPLPPATAAAEFVDSLEAAGFKTSTHWAELGGSTVLILVASR